MGTWIIGSVVLGAFAWTGYKTFKGLKSEGSCVSGCCGCSQASKCGKN